MKGRVRPQRTNLVLSVAGPADTVARSQLLFQATAAGSSPTCQTILQVAEAKHTMGVYCYWYYKGWETTKLKNGEKNSVTVLALTTHTSLLPAFTAPAAKEMPHLF